MPAKLLDNNEPGVIKLLDMEDGQVAEIVNFANYTGIVQRYNYALVKLGEPCGSSWSTLFENKGSPTKNTSEAGRATVRLLTKHDLVVFDNNGLDGEDE